MTTFPGSHVVFLCHNLLILKKIHWIFVVCLTTEKSRKESENGTNLYERTTNPEPSVKNVIVCADLEEAIRDADIISEAVSVPLGKWPKIKPEWIKPG